jgi:outer membrane protein assembly factor BamD
MSIYSGTVKILTLLALSLLVLSGCASLDSDPNEGLTAKELYEKATLSLRSGNFQEAIEFFETLEARYPFGQYALQTQLEIAYAYYKFDEMDSAIAAADRFIKLNPRNPKVDYAYYLKGLANFNRGRRLLERFFPRDLARTDQQPIRNAYRDFNTLATRWPNSQYAEDARQRMIYLRNKLADYELRTADFYLRRGALVAVVNRVKYMLEHYDGAPAMPDGLALMAEAYQRLGMNDLAADTLRILAANRPEHPALARLNSVISQPPRDAEN